MSTGKAAQHASLPATAGLAALLQGAFDALQEGILVIDGSGIVVAANHRFARLYPSLDTSVVGLRYLTLLRLLAMSGIFGTGRRDRQIEQRLAPVRDRRVYSMRSRQGDGTIVEIFGEPIEDDGYVFTFTDVTRQVMLRSEIEAMVIERTAGLKRENDELSALALRDPLLVILKRGGLSALGEAIRAENMRADRPMAVLMLDVDHFKRVNDTHGHAAGDLVLKSMAAEIGGAIGERDLLARHGGEEFVVLLPGRDEIAALRCAETIRQAVASLRLTFDDVPVRVTASIGVAMVGSEDLSIALAIAKADHASYCAKEAGRNCVARAAPGGAMAVGATFPAFRASGFEPPGGRAIPSQDGARW